MIKAATNVADFFFGLFQSRCRQVKKRPCTQCTG
jgi:hypothetical protein